MTMPFWDSTLIDTATKKSASAVDSDGDPSTYGAAVTFACRVQRSKDRNAEEIDHDAVLFTSTLILPTDRIWLPGDSTSDVNLARRPVGVYQTHDLDDAAAVFYKVLLGGA